MAQGITSYKSGNSIIKTLNLNLRANISAPNRDILRRIGEDLNPAQRAHLAISPDISSANAILLQANLRLSKTGNKFHITANSPTTGIQNTDTSPIIIQELSELGLDPYFNLSAELMRMLKINNLDKAWEYYLNNFEILPEVTKTLERMGFENPFLDKDGTLKKWVAHITKGIKSTEGKIIAIVNNILLKPKDSKKVRISDVLLPGQSLEQNIIYDNDRTEKKRGNGIQSANDILKSGYAQCLEFSYLFASAARIAGLKAGLILIPKHAFNWVEIYGERVKIDLTRFNQEKIKVLNWSGLYEAPQLFYKPASAQKIFAGYHWTKGFAFETQYRFNEAEIEYIKALEIDPNAEYIAERLVHLSRIFLAFAKTEEFFDSVIDTGSEEDIFTAYIKSELTPEETKFLKALMQQHPSIRTALEKFIGGEEI